MQVLFEYSQGCRKHINEDAYGYTEKFFWVIDGATDVFENCYLSALGDVHWVVQRLSCALKETVPLLPLKKAVRTAISIVRNEALAVAPEIQDIPINKLPTYAICCVCYEKDRLNYLCLGDCSIFSSKEPSVRYTDTRIFPFHFRVNAVKEQYKCNVDKYNSEVLKEVREIKQFINVEGGYWIGTLDPDIVEKSVEGSIAAQKGDKFLICSDGFRPNIDESQLVSFAPEDIFNVSKLENIIKKQISSEFNYLIQTGIDISDDRTILLAEI